MLNKIIMQKFTRTKTMPHKHHRKIYSLTAEQLELFVLDWVKLMDEDYFHVKQFAGTGDLGRDVVGFYGKERHDGLWDNYQCKQYGKTLNTDKGLLEIAKILYYSFKGEFSPPHNYYFVAPHGLNRKFLNLIYSPSKLKDYLFENWDKYCKTKLVDNSEVPLNNELKSFIDEYDFSKIKEIDINHMLENNKINFVLNKWFGDDVPEPPKSVTPKKIEKKESVYINKLLKCYESETEIKIKDIDDLKDIKKYLTHLHMQRERFFYSDVFKRFYRDALYNNQVEELEDDIYNGIFDVLYDNHHNSFSRMNKTLMHSASVEINGLLSQHINPKIKQGLCHHLANDNKIDWE